MKESFSDRLRNNLDISLVKRGIGAATLGILLASCSGGDKDAITPTPAPTATEVPSPTPVEAFCGPDEFFSMIDETGTSLARERYPNEDPSDLEMTINGAPESSLLSEGKPIRSGDLVSVSDRTPDPSCTTDLVQSTPAS